MKEVRINDRIWFGKYKGIRFSEIIKLDPNFIQKLLDDKKISLDKRCASHFESRMIGRKKTDRVQRELRWDPFEENIPNIPPPHPVKKSQVVFNPNLGEFAQNVKHNVYAISKNLFQEDAGRLPVSIGAITERFYEKIMEIGELTEPHIIEMFKIGEIENITPDKIKLRIRRVSDNETVLNTDLR